MRLRDRTAVIFGAGQTPGETVGNGRATAITFAREGAQVLAVDRDLDSALETVAQIEAHGGTASAVRADVTSEEEVRQAIAGCRDLWGRVDIVHNNVGVSLAGGDAVVVDIESDAFDRLVAINLRGMVYACKHALPVMREQGSGVILTISSAAAITAYPYVGYKTTKAAVIALTQQVAIQNARYGIRANCILPGLMNTPMAIEARVAATGRSREEIIAQRDSQVPLGGKMGTGWDVANAALFLASDEAAFITGVALPVDGGGSLRAG